MADYPLYDGQQYVSQAATVAAITIGASNVKTTYQQLVASTPFECFGLFAMVRPAQVGRYMIDFGIGGAGSEQTIISDFYTSCNGNSQQGSWTFFPIYIPAGTRIAARGQTTNASNQLAVCRTFLLGGGHIQQQPLGVVTTYGATEGTTQGIVLTSGGGATVYGSYAQVVASTTSPISHAVICFGNPLNSSNTYYVDFAIGGAGSEQTVLQSVEIQAPNINVPNPQSISFPISIPSGTRLAMRMASDAATQTLEAVVYGVS